MKVVRGLGNLQASRRGNCWDPAYSKAQTFHQPAASKACCAALRYRQYACHWFCLFLMNSEVITPHWKYIGAAIKICSCILISLSRLKISRLSSNNLLELQLKQKGFNSLQPGLGTTSSRKVLDPQQIAWATGDQRTGQGRGKTDLDFIWFHGSLTSSLIWDKTFKKKTYVHMKPSQVYLYTARAL